MTTNYHICESWGTDAHHLPGAYTLAALPPHARAAIAANPSATEWRVPALSHGDTGECLDDLAIVITPVSGRG